jgi:uridine phosphorylase
MPQDRRAPIVSARQFNAPSAFTPESLLREARRQKDLDEQPVPAVCLLDPDGDVVRRLQTQGRSRRHNGWACYHTEMQVFEQDGIEIGVIGCAVGAPFAVLVAEQLFASGCEVLISVTSAGQLAATQAPPYFILIDRALRDEGTSYHYLPAGEYSRAPASVLRRLEGAFDASGVDVLRGASWTTDAPFRETEDAIAAHRERGLLSVEMEAAALYALAEARQRNVVCFAHVTNQMGQVEGDFEKGEADGVTATLEVVAHCARRLVG